MYFDRIIFFNIILFGFIFCKELVVIMLIFFGRFDFLNIISGRGGKFIGVKIEVIEKWFGWRNFLNLCLFMLRLLVEKIGLYK